MLVYRITLEKWAGVLTASGYAARWNSKGIYMLYTASSRALASLENMVHRSGEGLNAMFKTTIISVPDELGITIINLETLSPGWESFEHYSDTQRIGDDWIRSMESCVLKVPSAIIHQEHNFLFNTAHPDFKKITVKAIEPFLFDSWLMR